MGVKVYGTNLLYVLWKSGFHEQDTYLNDVVYSSSFYDTRRKHMTQNVIYSRTHYGSDQKNISLINDTESIFPIIHSMTKKNGIGIVYSSEDKGHFNIPKFYFIIWEKSISLY
jgi:hypothetical protein